MNLCRRTLFPLCSVLVAAAAAIPAPNLTVAASFPLEVIQRTLFGLDFEFTRHDVWDGLSAELISNRLFSVQPAGTTWPQPWPAGFPPRWSALTSPSATAPSVTGLSSSVSCTLNTTLRLCGLVQLPVGDGFDAGMSFGSAIGLEAGRGYTFSAVVRASGTSAGAGLVLSVVLAPALFAVNLSVPDTAEWTTVTFSFVSGVTTPRADSLTLSVTASQGTLEFNATSLLPDDNFLGMRTDTVDALADLGFRGPLRYPGGCFAPFYKWKDGLLPLLSRPAAFTPSPYCEAVRGGVNAYTDGFMQNGAGIDEYIALTKRTGAIPAITVALQFGTPAEIQNAVDWVEYCNGDVSSPFGALRAARGHPAPYDVKIWYLGNEISSQQRWPNYPDDPANVTSAMSGSEYAAALAVLVPSLLAVDPSLTLLVVDGGADFDSPAWVSQTFTPFIHATSSHVGYANSDAGGSPASASAASAQAKIPTSVVRNDISAVRSFLDGGDGSAAHVAISVDEWGLGPPWVVQEFGVTHALFGSSFMTMVLNCAEEFGVVYTNYFEPVNEGAIDVLQFSATPTPLGVVMPFFGALAGGTRLAVSTAAGGDDDIVGVAAVTEGALTVVLTNRNASQGFIQWLHFTGVSVAPMATFNTLASNGGVGPGSYFQPSSGGVPVSADGWAAIEIPPFSVTSVRVEII